MADAADEDPADEDASDETLAPDDLLSFLASSPNRIDVLAGLAGDGPSDRYALEDAVDATRRTILRATNQLEGRGLVQSTDEGYRLTALGELVYDSYAAFAGTLAVDADLEAFLRRAPADVIDVDVSRFADAEVVRATAGSSYAPLDRLLSVRADASHVRELAPGVERRSIEQLASRVESGEDFSAEICLSPAVLEAAGSMDEYAPAQATIQGADCVEMYLTEVPIDLAVCIADDTVGLGVEDDDGRPVAVCVTEDPVVYEWADEYVAARIEDATPLEG